MLEEFYSRRTVKERKLKEHNPGMTETRAARVEQNTRHKAEPSTLYKVYRCINNIRGICWKYALEAIIK